MRRFVSLGALLVVLLASSSVPGVYAQEATATPEMTVSGELGVEHTGLGVVPAFVPTPAEVNYFRVHFPPGASLAYEPGDPGIGLWIVESGSLTLRGFSGDIMVARASLPATPDTTLTETLAAGAETRLGPGDGFVWTPLLGGEVRNDGTEPVVFISFDIRSAAQGGEQAATPAPE